jgi:hypothetical protein
MADVKLNPVFESFSKQIGDLVFYTLNGKTHVRRKVIPKNPRTPEQVEVRNALSELANDWSSMNGLMHKGWSVWSVKKGMKPNNAFVSENFDRQREGLPVDLFRAVGTLVLSSFTAEPGASGEITCSFAIEGDTAGKQMYFFTKKKDNGAASGEISMHTGGADPVPPFVISGLEPGAEYCVYAVVTNGVYSSATEVSQSLGLVCTAGA